jgi:ABC-2 type transport system permease protein
MGTRWIFRRKKEEDTLNRHPLWTMIQKEMSDQIRSWRFIILIGIIALTCMGSMYSALTQIGKVPAKETADSAFFFLKLFTLSDGTLPSFIVFIGFLGPLLGIGLGFDAINSEYSRGTLSRILSQPIYRDFVINSKFMASLAIVSALLTALVLLVVGWGLIAIGIPPTPDEILRIISFLIISICYVALWLNLSLFFSIKFRQASTSALAGLSIWLFFSIFYNMIINLLAKGLAPKRIFSEAQAIAFQNSMLNLMRINPIYLFNEATNILLIPTVRSTGALTMKQVQGTLPTPLPIGQSLLMVWPQVTGLIAGSIVLFALGYYTFMRQEIRSR